MEKRNNLCILLLDLEEVKVKLSVGIADTFLFMIKKIAPKQKNTIPFAANGVSTCPEAF